MKISDLKPNPKNPRTIKKKEFDALVESIKRDPDFLKVRGIVHAGGIILGGNMRYLAVIEAMKDVAFRERVGVKSENELPDEWVKDASNWTEKQRRRFIIVDNSPEKLSGEWDFEIIKEEFYDDKFDPYIYFDAIKANEQHESSDKICLEEKLDEREMELNIKPFFRALITISIEKAPEILDILNNVKNIGGEVITDNVKKNR